MGESRMSPGERGAMVGQRFDKDIAQRWLDRARRGVGMHHKIIAIRKIADTLATAVGDAAPCKAGCDHCCHVPLLMTHAEAKVIGKEIGRAVTVPARWAIDSGSDRATQLAEAAQAKDDLTFYGTPCPFLKDHRCSIYDHRPFACRVLYSMADDDVPCRISETPQRTSVPYLNFNPFYEAYAGALGSAVFYEIADIREFFPA